MKAIRSQHSRQDTINHGAGGNQQSRAIKCGQPYREALHALYVMREHLFDDRRRSSGPAAIFVQGPPARGHCATGSMQALVTSIHPRHTWQSAALGCSRRRRPHDIYMHTLQLRWQSKCCLRRRHASPPRCVAHAAPRHSFRRFSLGSHACLLACGPPPPPSVAEAVAKAFCHSSTTALF